MASDSDWMSQGVCNKHPELGTEDFHPDPQAPGYNQKVNRAKTICNVCTVRGLCLQFAIDHGVEEGVWGGMVPGERRSYERRRKAC